MNERGMPMAAAQGVRVVRAPNYAWIDVLDDAGAVWRYHRREWVGPAAGYFDLHFPFGEPRLMIQGDGIARLRQEGPGLPRQMVVQLPGGLEPGPGVAGGWEAGAGWHNYEQA
jgi:hypothetical protein